MKPANDDRYYHCEGIAAFFQGWIFALVAILLFGCDAQEPEDRPCFDVADCVVSNEAEDWPEVCAPLYNFTPGLRTTSLEHAAELCSEGHDRCRAATNDARAEVLFCVVFEGR